MATLTKTILLILFAAVATLAGAHHPPPSTSDQTKLINACTDALRPGSTLLTFCARDFLGHKAALLATCGKKEAAAIVAQEAQKRAKVVEEFGEKIKCDKSLSEKEHKDLKRCWKSMTDAVNTVGKVYVNVGFLKLSVGAVVEDLDEKVDGAMGKCRFSTAGRDNGLWSEFQAKSEVSLKAQVVALAFMDRYRSVEN